MNAIRTAIFTVTGLAIAALAAMFTASLLVALAGIGTVLLAARAISMKMQPEPVRVKANNGNIRRVWNDGRGTIVDM
ncbi:hypothetical protein [Rhizobium sp. L1K21]|uniref:hypothetical protein n=1 Tax=Rhizobium sp. L1K21 TaxID=2954933 RepID=UPI0020927E79|nr:hypothetical protein [Rhizobium sp. L1K21]MCO6184856.1 hypothetical protein [Rhizobium sp. L1K21]